MAIPFLGQRTRDHRGWFMSLEGLGRIYEHAKGKITVYVPADVVKDSAFPFEVGERVTVRIDKGTLVVEPIG